MDDPVEAWLELQVAELAKLVENPRGYPPEVRAIVRRLDTARYLLDRRRQELVEGDGRG